MPKTNSLPKFPFFVAPQISRSRSPVVALESTVITHGLPRPHNLQLALDIQTVVRENGAIPATIAVLDGKVHVGLTDNELECLATEEVVKKISLRDFATAIVKKECGGTTVAGTMFIAHQAGIRVFATGGIGGVHDVGTFDISTDLHALSNIPMVVVCAGPKAILDIAATLEYLETMGVPVVGYQTDEVPAFFSRQSGLSVSVKLDSPAEIVEFAKTHWEMGMTSSVLVCQPLPPDLELPRNKVTDIIQKILYEAHDQGIRGQSLTPFLLARMVELTGGESLATNKLLLLNNARLAAQIAVAFKMVEKQNSI